MAYDMTAPDFAARAIDARLRSMGIFQQAKAHPLLAKLVMGGRINQHPISLLDGNPVVSIPLNTDTVAALTIDTQYQPLSQQMTAGTPNYIVPTDFRRARFTVARYEVPVGVPAFDKEHQNPAYYGNVLEERMQAIQNRMGQNLAQMLSGSAAGSDTRVSGIRYLLSESNNVGGINQATNPFWQANVADHSTGAYTMINMTQDMQTCRRKATSGGFIGADNHIDCIFFGHPEGGLDLWSKLASTIEPLSRYGTEMNRSYGFTSWIYQGADIMVDFDSPVVDVLYLNSKTLHFVGDKTPKKTDEQRVPGKVSREYVLHGMHQLAIELPSANMRRTNIGS